MNISNLSFVDVETTGPTASNGRIIEIGILRVENNRLVKTYNTLINPETSVDPFVLDLTGITTNELRNAPTFHRVKNEILQVLENSIFVAHNVRFDYGFLKNEYKRMGINFSCRHFCTVKLTKLLYPGFHNYSLDKIIENLNIRCTRRHRAIDDAMVLWELYKKSLTEIDHKKLTTAINIALKRPTVPLNIKEEELDRLPETCGVYIFYGKDKIPIYIGKSVNIRDRILSHFSSDHLSDKEIKISRQIKRIEVIETAGNLGTLLLESSLVKKFLPLYNRQLRATRKMIALKKVVNEEGYYSLEEISLDEVGVSQLGEIIGIFRSRKKMRDCFFEIASKHGLCYKLLQLEKTDKCCFAYHLGRCKGACIGKENYLKYNMRFDEAFYNLKIRSWPFQGPIVIKEKGEIEEYFIIDKWCYLGSIKGESYFEDSIKKEYIFDFDTYKILLRYLSKDKNAGNITTLKSRIIKSSNMI